VWVKPQNTTSEFAVPFGARIVRTEKTQTLVCDDRNKQFWVPAGDVLKAMHITSQEGVEDMITLGDLQEYTILRNLQNRYAKQLIYVSLLNLILLLEVDCFIFLPRAQPYGNRADKGCQKAFDIHYQ